MLNIIYILRFNITKILFYCMQFATSPKKTLNTISYNFICAVNDTNISRKFFLFTNLQHIRVFVPYVFDFIFQEAKNSRSVSGVEDISRGYKSDYNTPIGCMVISIN